MSGLDFDDVRQAHGLDAVQKIVLDAINSFGKQDRKDVFTLSELMSRKPPAMIVDGIIPEASFGSFTGATGTFKSFAVVHLMTCLAYGLPFFGHTTKKTNCLLIVGEGSHGIGQRFKAALRELGLDTPDNVHVKIGLDLLNQSDLDWVSQHIREHDIGFVAVDTLARSFSGDENSAKDMGGAISAIDRNITAHGAACAVVHHSGHGDQKRARGSSAFRAALDFEIGFEQAETAMRLVCWKSKDVQPFDDLAFTTKRVATGDTDSTGNLSYSLVIEQCDLPDRKLELSPQQKDVHEIICAIGAPGAPFTLEKLIQAVKEGTDIKRNVARVVRQTLGKLQQSGAITEFGGQFLVNR